MEWFMLLLFPLSLIVAAIVYATTEHEAAWLIPIAALILALFNGCGYKQALHNSIESRTFTVTHKERTGGDNGKWLVFTNHGVFSVEDSLWLFKYDASDRYNRIKVGHTYTCEVAGWRIHFTSGYENLIKCREVA